MKPNPFVPSTPLAPLRRWWGFAERLDRAAQIGEGITDRNQPVALTLHGFILPCSSDKTYRRRRVTLAVWVRPIVPKKRLLR